MKSERLKKLLLSIIDDADVESSTEVEFVELSDPLVNNLLNAVKFGRNGTCHGNGSCSGNTTCYDNISCSGNLGCSNNGTCGNER